MSNDKKATIILDVDGVLNNYSNYGFYMQFMRKSMNCLAKVRSRRELLKELPALKELGGASALFVFAHRFCPDEEKFKQYKKNLIQNLNFDLIKYDPEIKHFLGRLSQFGNIIIRSDGLSEISLAIWDRIINDKPSDKIIFELKKYQKDTQNIYGTLNNNPVIISGIEENNFSTKQKKDSWKVWAKKQNIDLNESILIDDSHRNIDIAESLGMGTLHISKLDSLVCKKNEKSLFGCSFQEVIGNGLSSVIQKYNISYGSKVNPKTLFTLLKQQLTQKDFSKQRKVPYYRTR